jgi:hypothetical protein
MPDSRAKAESGVLRPAGLAAVALGLALAVASAAAPDRWLAWLSPAAHGWTTEKATEHQQASADLHRLSLTRADNEVVQQRLREARQRFADSESALREAADGPRRVRDVLRGGGVVLLVAGVVALAFAHRGDR